MPAWKPQKMTDDVISVEKIRIFSDNLPSMKEIFDKVLFPFINYFYWANHNTYYGYD